MSEREQAIQLLNAVPDYKMGYVIAYLQGAVIGEDEPNVETMAAMQELKSGGGEVFNGSTEEFFNMLLEDD